MSSAPQNDVQYRKVRLIIRKEAKTLLSLARHFKKCRQKKTCIGRVFLSHFHVEASHTEELLDLCGALYNNDWYVFRTAVAITKHISSTLKILNHLQSFIPTYHLGEISEAFEKETHRVLDLFLTIFHETCSLLLKQAEKLSVKGVRCKLPETRDYYIPDIRLPKNKDSLRGEYPVKVVLHLATKMLHLTEASKIFDGLAHIKKENYLKEIPAILSEAQTSKLENTFHMLQTLYDTHLSRYAISDEDGSLLKLRGHISVIYHILEGSSVLLHCYERHLCSDLVREKLNIPCIREEIMNSLASYFCAYIVKFSSQAKDYCQKILHHYAISDEIKVSIPNYRGFHVRPSTLIAKIVGHYGSEVIMSLNKLPPVIETKQFEEEIVLTEMSAEERSLLERAYIKNTNGYKLRKEFPGREKAPLRELFKRIGVTNYSAGSPFELFRANELINLYKRHYISQYLIKNAIIKEEQKSTAPLSDFPALLREIFLKLIGNNQIILYDNDMSFSDMFYDEDDNLTSFSNRAISRYLAMGKIDVITNAKVTFSGDKRVLDDIRTLAENGYGEDKYGNNIMLPKELSYLR